MHAPAALLALLPTAARHPAVTDGAAAAADGAGPIEVIMNPFGIAFVGLTWAVLVGLNLWCLRKLLRHRKTRPPATN